MTDLRKLDIKIAKALGFFVKKGALYAPPPDPTLLGGIAAVHFQAAPETDEIIEKVWRDYTPHFSSNMTDAFWLLNAIWEQHSIAYNLFRDLGDWHTCEIGYWADEAAHSDELWQESEKDPALAIARAVAKCPVVMGEDVGAN